MRENHCIYCVERKSPKVIRSGRRSAEREQKQKNMSGKGPPSAMINSETLSPNSAHKSLKIVRTINKTWTPSKNEKTSRPSCQLDGKMAPKVLSGTTLGPQMATKIHHRVPQNSPRALPSWPPSHTLAIISFFFSFLVPLASIWGAL